MSSRTYSLGVLYPALICCSIYFLSSCGSEMFMEVIDITNTPLTETVNYCHHSRSGAARSGTDDRFLSSVSQPALDHRHCSSVSTMPAFTGLFSTYSIRSLSSSADRIQWSNDSSCQKGVPVRPTNWLPTRPVLPLSHRITVGIAACGWKIA